MESSPSSGESAVLSTRPILLPPASPTSPPHKKPTFPPLQEKPAKKKVRFWWIPLSAALSLDTAVRERDGQSNVALGGVDIRTLLSVGRSQDGWRFEAKRRRGEKRTKAAVELPDIDAAEANIAPPVDAQTAMLLMWDSGEASEATLGWLLSPLSVARFFSEYWEQRPLHILRQSPEAYEGVFSTKALDSILRSGNLEFGRSLDLTQYRDGQRRTLSEGKGKVYAPLVWDHYNQGCSVRLRDPAAHSHSLWRLCSVLQEAFGSFVGANV